MNPSGERGSPLRKSFVQQSHSIAPTLLVAIDISKHRHEVLIGVPGKKRRRRMTILNTLDDFQSSRHRSCHVKGRSTSVHVIIRDGTGKLVNAPGRKSRDLADAMKQATLRWHRRL
jgi:hypothetical protein